jgi:hypothetical protein
MFSEGRQIFSSLCFRADSRRPTGSQVWFGSEQDWFITRLQGICGEEAKMCLLCADGLEGRKLARRAHVLQLLALVEDLDALPVNSALRLGGEILALTQTERAGPWCDSVVPHGLDIGESH